MYKISSY